MARTSNQKPKPNRRAVAMVGLGPDAVSMLDNMRAVEFRTRTNMVEVLIKRAAANKEVPAATTKEATCA